MRQKSKFKNVGLSKELAALGWTQVGDNKWVRVYTHKGQVFPAVIWRTYTKTKTFTHISPEGWDDRIPVVAAQCSDPLEASHSRCRGSSPSLGTEVEIVAWEDEVILRCLHLGNGDASNSCHFWRHASLRVCKS